MYPKSQVVVLRDEKVLIKLLLSMWGFFSEAWSFGDTLSFRLDLFPARDTCGPRQGRTALGCFEFSASPLVKCVIGGICYSHFEISH